MELPFFVDGGRSNTQTAPAPRRILLRLSLNVKLIDSIYFKFLIFPAGIRSGFQRNHPVLVDRRSRLSQNGAIPSGGSPSSSDKTFSRNRIGNSDL